jgi:hypothetical protein
MLLVASRAVTVKLNEDPAVALAGALTLKWVAAPAETAMVPEVPVVPEETVSVAVMVWLPTVLRVAPEVNVWTPLSPARNV